MRTQSHSLLVAFRRGSAARRGLLALLLACSASLVFALVMATERARSATERLNSAAVRLDSLTDAAPTDTTSRAAIAWGYAERLRLGLESPFRLIEASARDPRLTAEERRTVSWGLLARVRGGETHHVDPATLDGIGNVTGETHLGLITRAIGAADDARAGELAVRIAYTLAAAERLVEERVVPLVSGVAALVADREIARREAHAVLLAEKDAVGAIAERRAHRSLYLERPALFTTTARQEGDAVEISRWLVDSLRARSAAAAAPAPFLRDTTDRDLAPRLYEAAALMPPAAPLVVAVRRHLPLLRRHATKAEVSAIERSHNPEMLAAALNTDLETREERRVIGRLMVAVAVAMRSQSQDAVWFPGDSAPAPETVALRLGVAAVTFDADVPKAWRPYFLEQLADGVDGLRGVFPSFGLETVRVRFRMTPPADSALAMHDPRSRTLHLPVLTAAGTLTHELAHELDRQVAVQQGHSGYRSDFVTRNTVRDRARRTTSSVSASLRALTEDTRDAPARSAERPAEIFATQVDWFVARALASRGMTNGFLTAVQDEVLTGHVVHPERLRVGPKARPLLDALRGMTTVAPFAAVEGEPTLHALLRWSLGGPVDRVAAASILAGAGPAWTPPRLEGTGSECAAQRTPRAELVRLAAESRARGWLRQRARWAGNDARAAAWVRAVNGHAPWAPEAADARAAQLRDHILGELAAEPLLASGLAARGASLAELARCLG